MLTLQRSRLIFTRVSRRVGTLPEVESPIRLGYRVNRNITHFGRDEQQTVRTFELWPIHEIPVRKTRKTRR